MTDDARTGMVARVNGPLVEIDGLPGVAMGEMVELDPAGVQAEVVAISGSRTTLQAYEYTGGLAPGARARARGFELSATMGPWLLGGVFDGLLRPLPQGPIWLQSATSSDASKARAWSWRPLVKPGDPASPGATLGALSLKPELQGTGRQMIFMLIGLSAFVLLIACANLANLQLARATAKIRELAIRAALGASRKRLIWGQVLESVLLSGAGGALGLILAASLNQIIDRSFVLNGDTGGLNLGLDPKIVAASHAALSLSTLTFTHGEARAVLFEQLYRAMTVLAGKTYHY